VLNFPNGKVYVGISYDAANRLKGHLRCAAKGSKLPVHCAIRKYGIEKITQKILCIGTRGYIAELEIKLIKKLSSQDHANGYNLSLGGDLSPMKSDVVRKKVSATKKKLFSDPSYQGFVKAHAASMEPIARAKLLAAIRSPEVSAAKSIKLKGRKQSPKALEAKKAMLARPEVKAKQSASCKAAWASIELRSAQSARFKGKQISAEHRAKISASLMGHIGHRRGIERSAEVKKKISSSRMGIKVGPEGRKNMSEAQKKRFANMPMQYKND